MYHTQQDYIRKAKGDPETEEYLNCPYFKSDFVVVGPIFNDLQKATGECEAHTCI